MKVQFESGRMRVRLDEGELADLLDGAALQLDLPLGPAAAGWQLGIALQDAGQARCIHDAQSTQVLLPAMQVGEYAARLPCREGLMLTLEGDHRPSIQLEFSVDVRDSVRVRGPRRRTPS